MIDEEDEEIIGNEPAVADDHEIASIQDDSETIKDESLVGAGSAILSTPDIATPPSTFTSRALFQGRSVCNNCKGNRKQQPKHCRITSGTFNDTCSNRHCDCKCRTYALSAEGKLVKINFVEQVVR